MHDKLNECSLSLYMGTTVQCMHGVHAYSSCVNEFSRSELTPPMIAMDAGMAYTVLPSIKCI